MSATVKSPGPAEIRNRATGRRRADRVFDQVREHLENAVRIGGRGSGAVGLGGKVDAYVARGGPMAAERVLHDLSEVDRLEVDGERALVQPSQVEQVTHEPLESLRLRHDDPGRRRHVEHTVEERFAVAPDRGQRGLQLVAHRQQKRLLGLFRPLELLRHLVERSSEPCDLVGALDGERHVLLPGRKPLDCERDAFDGAYDRTGEQERREPSDQHSDRRSDRECNGERLPVRCGELGLAEKDDRLLSLGSRRVEIVNATDGHRPLRRAACSQCVAPGGRQQQGRLRERQDCEALLLGVEEDTEAGQRLPVRGRSLLRRDQGQPGARVT